MLVRSVKNSFREPTPNDVVNGNDNDVMTMMMVMMCVGLVSLAITRFMFSFHYVSSFFRVGRYVCLDVCGHVTVVSAVQQVLYEMCLAQPCFIALAQGFPMEPLYRPYCLPLKCVFVYWVIQSVGFMCISVWYRHS